MSETPEQPEGNASPQDMDLEAQLDDLLHQLEEVDPQTVPTDLRKNKPAEPVTAEPATDEPVTAEAPAEESPPQPQATAEPITEPAETSTAKPQALTQETPTADQANPDTTDSTNTAGQGLDLDAIASMAADLLDQQIDATIESAAGDTESKETETSTPAEPTQPASAEASKPVAVEEAKPKPIVPMDDDDLASQIQGLLNEVQTKGVDAIPDKEPTAQTAEQTPQAVEAGEAAAEPESDEPAEVVEPAQAVTAVEATDTQPPAEATDVPIDQIDAMLAESAQQAIEHGPAPTADIPPGTDELLAAQAKAEQEAQARAKAERDAAELPSAQEANAEPQPAPVAEPVAAEPQPMPTPGASAEDVAKELDEDAQPAPVPAEDSAQPVSAESVAVDVPGANEVVIKTSGLKKAERVLLKLCGKINRPLNRLSPEMRDTVGYAGVVTTALALFMVLYGVFF